MMRLLVTLLVLTTFSSVRGDICSSSFCTCEEGDVSCTGSDTEKLSLSAGSLPPSIVSLHLTNLASLLMETNTFTGQQELKEFSIENIKKVVLEELAYSKEEVAGHVTHFKIEGVEDLQLGGSEAFTNFPQSSHVEFRNVKIKTIPVEGLKLYSDTMVIADCDIGQLDRESIYSDSQTFQFSNNKVGLIKEKAFSGSNNKFNFSDNDVGMMESNAISVAFLSGDVSRNTIHNFAGTPLRDIGPEPICMPDTDAYSYDDSDSPVTIEYNVVGSPSLVFQGNYFHQFSLKVLDFPGAHNVPLGALSISDNKVPCDCETIKELAILADFDHISDVNGENLQVDFGDNIFKKEFYTSSLCVTDAGEVVRLKRFARAWLAVAGYSVQCSNPKDRVTRRMHKDNSDKNNEKKLVNEISHKTKTKTEFNAEKKSSSEQSSDMKNTDKNREIMKSVHKSRSDILSDQPTPVMDKVASVKTSSNKANRSLSFTVVQFFIGILMTSLTSRTL